MTTKQTTNADPVMMEALKEAWSAGFQQAVDALRDMQDEFGDEQSKALIRALAITLQEMMP